MALFPLQFPPGIYHNGTEYQGKGRWRDCNLVRFHQGAIMPIGGWRVKSTSTVTGKGRAIINWMSNNGSTFAAVGTESHLYAMSRSGVLYNITPSGFTPGRGDAVAGGGYGADTYGTGIYGIPRVDATTVQEASIWTLDTFGEYLVGCMAEDGNIYQWELDTATIAAKVTNSPTATSIFVTTEGMLVGLAAAGVPRRVQWSDQRDNTVWTASAANSAGDLDLQTEGHLLQGLRFSNTHLIFTDVDVWTMTFTPTESVYDFQMVPGGCGVASRNSAIVAANSVVWMGQNGFHSYNGYVQSLVCGVWDEIFGNLNRQQMTKITVELNSGFNEVTWHFPSINSTEVDMSVTWNYHEDHWRVGYVSRLVGCDRGVFQYPLATTADGNVYEHEVGYSYDGLMPYLESGPFDIADGNAVQYATKLLPDEATQGQVTATFLVKFAPEDVETSFGPYSLSKYTDVRWCARQARLRYDGVANTAWRVGTPRLDVTAGGGR